MTLQKGACEDESGSVEFPFLPMRPDKVGYSATASMQALYSSGTYEFHDHLVAEANRRPPAEWVTMYNVAGLVACHASQTVTQTLAKEVAHLREELKKASGTEQVKVLEGARDRALAEAKTH